MVYFLLCPAHKALIQIAKLIQITKKKNPRESEKFFPTIRFNNERNCGVINVTRYAGALVCVQRKA